MRFKSAFLQVTLALLVANSAEAADAQVRFGKLAEAQPGEFRVFVMAAIKGPLETVLTNVQQKIGKPIVVEYGGSRGSLHDAIVAGQAFEVAILLPDVNEEILKKGMVAPGTYPIAMVPIALGIRGEAPAGLDVASEAGLKKAMLGAKSVKYAPTGAAITTVKTIFSKLDIGDKVKDTSAQSGTVALGPGEYEMNIFPFSEIEANKALRNLGNVIAPLQVSAGIEATIGAHANDLKAALTFVKFLQGPEIDAGLKANMMVKAK